MFDFFERCFQKGTIVWKVMEGQDLGTRRMRTVRDDEFMLYLYKIANVLKVTRSG